jgi:hypothetical protein
VEKRLTALNNGGVIKCRWERILGMQTEIVWLDIDAVV